MNHKFAAGLANKENCKFCGFPVLPHLNLSGCETCGKVGMLEIFFLGRDKALLCEVCISKEMEVSRALEEVTMTPEAQAERVEVMNVTMTVQQMAREIDSSIHYNGDVFNAKTVALIEVKKSIDAEAELSAEQKNYKFQEFILTRYQHLKARVFELDGEKIDLITEQMVIQKSLRELGEEVRKEIREGFKIADANYTPPEKIVKPRLPKQVSVSPMEKLIKVYAKMFNCSESVAEEMIRKGKS